MNFFVSCDQIENDFIFIRDSDVNHIRNVLRRVPGDVIDVVSDGYRYRARIEELNQEFVKCCIIEKQEVLDEDFKLTIFQGLAKADKLEYIIQKCTELGVFEIVPVEMKRCVVKLDGKDREKKLDRWKKIAEVASKQSIRNEILRVDRILDFTEMCDVLNDYELVILAYEKEKDVTLKSVIRGEIKGFHNVAVIIGPEGGIDDEEANELKRLGVRTVTLGKRILRTETAPVAVAAIIMYEVGE